MALLLAALVTVVIHNTAHVPPEVLTRAQAPKWSSLSSMPAYRSPGPTCACRGRSRST
jgi:hypothetical protein